MKPIYEKHKGMRFKSSGFFGVTNMGINSYWWSEKLKKWLTWDELDAIPRKQIGTISSHAPCRSVKAFQRMMKKQNLYKKGFMLCHRYVGYAVVLKGDGEMFQQNAKKKHEYNQKQ